MSDPKEDDEAKFNETLKRMLSTPPTPHTPKGDKKPSGGKPKPKPKPTR
jgi:hypothetical protein